MLYIAEPAHIAAHAPKREWQPIKPSDAGTLAQRSIAGPEGVITN